MTTTSRDARLARLTAATAGDTVTVPDDWEAPDGDQVTMTVAELLIDLEPGEVFTHNGDTDGLCWWHDRHGFAFTTDLAELGLEPDAVRERWAGLDAVPVGAVATLDEPTAFGDDDFTVGIGTDVRITGAKRYRDSSGRLIVWMLEAEGYPGWPFHVSTEQIDALGLTPDDFTTPDDEPIVTDTVPDGGAIAGDFSDETWGSAPADDDEDGDPVIGTVTVEVVPDTTGFVDAVKRVAREASDVVAAEGLALGEAQKERVLALEHARRVLEARRGKPRPAIGLMQTIGTTASTGEVVPARDLIAVAAFIADGEVRA